MTKNQEKYKNIPVGVSRTAPVKKRKNTAEEMAKETTDQQ